MSQLIGSMEDVSDEIIGTLSSLGIRGYSAYQLAVKHGFTGTEQEYLDSLRAGIDIKTEDGKVYYKYANDDNWIEMLDITWVEDDIDNLQEQINTKASQEDIADKADKSEIPTDFYTKSEIDNMLSTLPPSGTGGNGVGVVTIPVYRFNTEGDELYDVGSVWDMRYFDDEYGFTDSMKDKYYIVKDSEWRTIKDCPIINLVLLYNENTHVCTFPIKVTFNALNGLNVADLDNSSKVIASASILINNYPQGMMEQSVPIISATSFKNMSESGSFTTAYGSNAQTSNFSEAIEKLEELGYFDE